MKKGNYRFGMSMAMICAVMWGVLPVYWKILYPISELAITVYRIFFVAVSCGIASIFLYGKKRMLAPLKDKKMLFNTVIAGILITLNWALFLWAVNSGQVFQTSIGYYMEPLIVSLFGVIIFHEPFNLHRKIAFALAATGVAILIIHSGQVPLLAITLGVTFAIYATVKKSVDYPSILGLFYETVFFSPFMLAIMVYLEINNIGAIGIATPLQMTMLILSGAVTALPLIFFAIAAQNLPLISLGVTEYIAPTITLLIGIYVFKEPFDMTKLITFIFIWIALIFFTIGEIKMQKNNPQI